MENTYSRKNDSKALVNTDLVALEAYRKRRSQIASIESDINILKSEFKEIKGLLQLLIGKD